MMGTNGHRWTTEELQQFIGMWLAEKELCEIARAFGVSMPACNKIVTRLRKNGIPLPYRKRGHKAARKDKLWTPEEIEYLARRREDGATAEELSNELGRTFYGVQAMVLKLRQEGVPLRQLGQGRRRLWSSDDLKAAIAGRAVFPLRVVGE